MNLNQDRRMQVIYGPAGVGKSAVARAVCEELGEEYLGASFFFQRGLADCNDPYLVFPTIAYQLAYSTPELLSHVVQLVDKYVHEGNSQGIAHQGRTLLLSLLDRARLADRPLVIVLDGADECLNNDANVVQEMLQVFCRAADRFPFLRILITTRPETYIMKALPTVNDPTAIMRDLWEDGAGEVTGDIETFIQSKFDQCARRGGFTLLRDRPNCTVELARLANRLFVYAATAVRFIISDEHFAVNIYDDLLASHRSVSILGLHAPIDALYATILETAFRQIRADPDRMDHVHNVLTWFVLAEYDFLPEVTFRADNFALIGIPTNITMDMINRLRSVLIVQGDVTPTTALKPYHLSFREFLGDSSRCRDPAFLVEPQSGHALIANSLLKLLPRGYLDAVPQDSDGDVSLMWLYARMYWSHHLIHTQYTLLPDCLLRAFAETCAEQCVSDLSTVQFWTPSFRFLVDALAQARDWCKVCYQSSSLRAPDLCSFKRTMLLMKTLLRFSTGSSTNVSRT